MPSEYFPGVWVSEISRLRPRRSGGVCDINFEITTHDVVHHQHQHRFILEHAAFMQSLEDDARLPTCPIAAFGRSIPRHLVRIVKQGLRRMSTFSSRQGSSASSSTTATVRPTLDRSRTMPAIRCALSVPSVEKSLASLLASSTKGIRRMATFGRRNSSGASSSTVPVYPDSTPSFTTPNYGAPSCSSRSENISPLTRPGLKRTLTMPAAVRALRSTTLARLPSLKKAVCERPPRKSSVSSVESVSSVFTTSTTSIRRRSSSVSSIESFSSTEGKVAVALRLRALPSTLLGFFTSLVSVLLITLLPSMAAETPKRTLAIRPYECKIILTEEQEGNPPTAPKATPRLTKAYRRTLRRATRARGASTPTEALAVLFAPIPKHVRAFTPVPVDPKTLATDVPLIIYSSPVALPLPKGPAPAIRPARKAHKFAVLPTMQEEELDAALCPGW
ncbi:hypothetical protein DFH07DRAFT_825491 [Mycena maculata]|uniref:Uncharacterized protein n=1 Tax=Mycena maculata TaxID=230809 RepID=A0AAD7N9J2_9AGAR|nr:hypothetical protein DFH07DRAFT_825491 [Mycena maculata]